MFDLLLADIASIRTREALRIWGERWREEIIESGHRDEIAMAYEKRMEELK